MDQSTAPQTPTPEATPIPPSPQSTPAPEQPKSKKKLIIMLLIPIIFLIIAVVIYLLLFKGSSKPAQSSTADTQPLATSTPAPTPSATPALNLNTTPASSSSQTALVPADSQTPAAGTCLGPSTDKVVTVSIGLDNVPQPRCVKVTSTQKLNIINNSDKTIQKSLGQYNLNVASGETQTIDAGFGTYLAPGVHDIVGEIWLQ